MSSFTKVWAVKSDTQVPLGTAIAVALKNGSVKLVVVSQYLGQRGDAHFYLPAPRQQEAEAA